MKNGNQQATKPPTTMLSVCAAFVSRLIDEMRIGIRLALLNERFFPTPDAHDSDIDV